MRAAACLDGGRRTVALKSVCDTSFGFDHFDDDSREICWLQVRSRHLYSPPLRFQTAVDHPLPVLWIGLQPENRGKIHWTIESRVRLERNHRGL